VEYHLVLQQTVHLVKLYISTYTAMLKLNKQLKSKCLMFFVQILPNDTAL